MRTLQYDNDELFQFEYGGDWFIFTEDLVIHAPIDRILTVIEDIYQNKPEILFLQDLDLCNAIESYKEQNYPELCI